jgi:hypothetical protein
VQFDTHVPELNNIQLGFAIRASVGALLGNSNGMEGEAMLQIEFEAHTQCTVVCTLPSNKN